MTDELVGSTRSMILVADDDHDVRSLFATVLTTAGFDVITAVDGEDALEQLAAADVSLLLLDSSMPISAGSAVVPPMTRFILGTEAVSSFFFRIPRSIRSSASSLPKSFLSEYHLERQSLVTAMRNPIGLVF